MADKLAPQINIPLEVGPLAYDTPKAYPPREYNGTQYGASWGYGTPAGTFYADEKCQAAIVASGVRIAKGASFTVLKGKEADGKTNKWTITGQGPGATTTNSPPQGQQRAASGLTWADINFAARESLFAASADLSELAALKEGGPQPSFDNICAQAAVRFIQGAQAGCLPRSPKAKPNLDGEHTKEFLAWLSTYRVREDIAPLWPGAKDEFSKFIAKAASKANIVEVLESNDPVMFEHCRQAVLVETAQRDEAAKSAPAEDGQAEIPF